MLWLISCLALVASTIGCGVPAIKPQISGYNRIVKGENPVSGSWPWQVSLQVGIVSWGTTNCNVRAPAVYARISYLRGWIDQTIASN